MRVFIFLLDLIALLYGLYCAVVNNFSLEWSGAVLPKGMGIVIILISITLLQALKEIKEIANSKEKSEKITKDLLTIFENGGNAFPVHETEFYSIWKEQVRNAVRNIDVTHLATVPPSKALDSENEYFNDLKKLYSNTKAMVRRVERYHDDKKDWIQKLIENFEGVPNFSLSVILDPSTTETPYSLSVSRIDDKTAWIVAVAEHQSTTGYRDLLINGSDSVKLLTSYFNERLWNRSILVINNGKLDPNWENKLEITNE